MPSTAIESQLFGGSFGNDEMKELFSDESLVACCLRVEAALARAEALVGLIPEEAAREISEKASHPENFPVAAIRKGMEANAHSFVALVNLLAAACSESAGGWVHWGATTQDIFDTANQLRHQVAFDFTLNCLCKIRDALAKRAEEEADTLMVARTHGQHALPTTFGYKLAVLCWEVNRQIERWEQAKPRVLVGNITGAVGTFAGFGDKGAEVQRVALEELGLGVPEICWHSSRDRMVEIASLFTTTSGTLEKIAAEIYRLATTEYGEVEEPFFMGKVGSSTMPHKRNNVTCEAVISCGRAIRGEASILFDCQIQEHERHSGLWKTEWIAIPNCFIMLGSQLTKMLKVVSELHVDRERMKSNLNLLRGAIASEAVMLKLGQHVGRQRAHELVYKACMKSFEQKRPMKDCLLEEAEVEANLSGAEIDKLLDYWAYVGAAPQLARAPAAMFLKNSPAA
jgi:adenylosuccinate lyase